MATHQPLTIEQAIIISGFTGTLIAPFDKLHEEIERRLKRPVFTHELGSKETWDEIKKSFRDDFLALAPKEEPPATEDD